MNSAVPFLPKPFDLFLRSLQCGLTLLSPLLWRAGLIVGLVVIVNLTTARFVVEGSSMEPTLAEGQNLWISRANYWLSTPQRGDLIVFQSDTNPSVEVVKRIIGLPGETIEFRATDVYIDGQLLIEPYLVDHCSPSICPDSIWTIGANYYFVMGDNRNHSRDSRAFGMIAQGNIIGEVIFRYLPIADMKWIDS